MPREGAAERSPACRACARSGRRARRSRPRRRGRPRGPVILAALEAAGMAVASVKVARPSLDDVYLRYAGRAFGRPTPTTERSRDDRTARGRLHDVRELRSLLRQPWWIAITLVQPIIWLLLYGALFKRVVEIPGFGATSYIQFLTPGVVDHDRAVLGRLGRDGDDRGHRPRRRRPLPGVARARSSMIAGRLAAGGRSTSSSSR